MNKLIISVLFSVLFTDVFGQISEDFSGSTFSKTQFELGDTSHFILNNEKLQLNQDAAGTSAIFAPSNAISKAIWQWDVQMTFNTSASNYVDVWLAADTFKTNASGYFIRIGGTEDDVSLYVADDGVHSKLIDGKDGVSSTTDNQLTIKVERDSIGNWKLSADSATTGYQLMGEAFDSTVTKSKYFGFECTYSLTRAKKFYFDNVLVSGEVQQYYAIPQIDTLIQLSTNSIQVQFASAMDTSWLVSQSVFVLNDTIDLKYISIKNERSVEVGFDNHFTSEVNSMMIQRPKGKNGILLDQLTYEFKADINPPVVTHWEVWGDSLLFMQLSEHVPALSMSSFSVKNGQGVEVVLTGNITAWDSLVFIPKAPFSNGQQYEISIVPLTDKYGKMSEIYNTSFVFYKSYQASYLDVIINEIMSDPTPTHGLPEVEYIELYNSTANKISLDGWILHGVDGTKFNGISLLPGEYLIVAPDNDLYNFKGKKAGWISGSLLNEGELIKLEDHKGNIIDSVTYKRSWLWPDKDDGGWSLERIDPFKRCSNEYNWVSSEDQSGGTPGYQNAVFKHEVDTIAPRVLSQVFVQNDSLILTLSEPIAEVDTTGDSFIIEQIDQAVEWKIKAERVYVKLPSGLEHLNVYMLHIPALLDCEGNGERHRVTFKYDGSGPQLNEWIWIDSTKIKLVFNEPLAHINSILAVETTLQDTLTLNGTLNEVILSFKTPLKEEAEYHVDIKNLEDSIGNVSSITQNIILINSIDTILVHSENVIEVRITEEVDGLDQAKIEIVGGPTISSTIHDTKNKMGILINTTEALRENKELWLNIDGLTNIEGARMQTPLTSFVYDTKPPKILAVSVMSDREIITRLSEPIDTTKLSSLNFKLDELDYGEGLNIKCVSPNELSIRFELVLSSDVHKLYYQNIQDLHANQYNNTQSISFLVDFESPFVVEISPYDPQTVKIEFNEYIGTLGQVSSEFPIDSVYLSQCSNELIFARFHDVPGMSARIYLSNFMDIAGNVMVSDSLDVDLSNVAISEVGLYTDSSLFIRLSNFSEPSRVSLNESEANEIRRINGTDDFEAKFYFNLLKELQYSMIVQTNQKMLQDTFLSVISQPLIRYEGDQLLHLQFNTAVSKKDFTPDKVKISERQVLFVNCEEDYSTDFTLFMNQVIAPNEELEIALTPLQNACGGYQPGHKIAYVYDVNSPSIKSAEFLSPVLVEVQFSESMDTIFLHDGGNYEIDGLAIQSVQIHGDSVVQLRLKKPPLAGLAYSLYVSDLVDMAGNELENPTINVVYDLDPQPKFGQLIITEVMADPSPTIGLPEAEYIEIFNQTNAPFELVNADLVLGADTLTISYQHLASSEILILCANADTAILKKYGHVIGLSSWPGINSTLDTIQILNYYDELVNATVYNKSFHESEKKEGGWSLERGVNSLECFTPKAWKSSGAEAGGTPGKVNSWAYELMNDGSLTVVNRYLVSDTKFEIILNEGVKPTQRALRFESNPASNVEGISISGPFYNVIEVEFANVFKTNQLVTYEVGNVETCAGLASISGEFVLPDSGIFKDVIFTEVMFDPLEGWPEYIEIYNRSEKYIDIKEWVLTKTTEKDVKSEVVVEETILKPETFYVLVKDENSIKTFYPHVPVSGIVPFNLPSLNNDGAILTLKNSTGLVIDSIGYKQDMHHPLLRQTDGVALERVTLGSEMDNRNLWKSAAQNAGFATPAQSNSSQVDMAANSSVLSLSAPSFSPDDALNNSVDIFYKLDKPGVVGSLFLVDINGRKVRQLASNSLLGGEGYFTWYGESDTGSRCHMGYYVVVLDGFYPDGSKVFAKEKIALVNRLR